MARKPRASTTPPTAGPGAPLPPQKPGARVRVMPVYAGCPLGVTSADREPDGFILVHNDSATALEAAQQINDK